MAKVTKSVAKLFGLVLDLVQVALALLVVVLVSWRLLKVSRTQAVTLNTRCLLDGTGLGGALRGTQFCVYAIAVGLVSVIATAVLRCANRCLGCITANVCGITNFVSIAIDAVLCAWWVVAFILFINRGIPANNLNFPEEPARNGVIAAAFGAALSFGLDILFTLCGIASS